MGESFVALPSDPAALIYNPAGLAGLSGINVSYSHRGLNWVAPTDGWSISTINAAVATSFGVFGAQYNRKSMGTLPVTTVRFPDGDGTELSLYSHDIALGYALRLPRGPALGVSAKYYDYVESVSGPTSGLIAPLSTTPSYLFDFGIIYTLPQLHDQTVIGDSITVGMSYQNTGTRWKATRNSPGVSMPPELSSQSIQLPEYFRIGISCALRIAPPEGGDLSPFAAVLSGEFRSLQNPISPSSESSFWGVGLECTLFEYVSLRAGASFRPFTDFEGERDRASFRYGAAVRLPVGKLGSDIPLALTFQYALIPLNQLEYYSLTGSEQSSMSVFSIDIQYSGYPW